VEYFFQVIGKQTRNKLHVITRLTDVPSCISLKGLRYDVLRPVLAPTGNWWCFMAWHHHTDAVEWLIVPFQPHNSTQSSLTRQPSPAALCHELFI